MFVAAISNFVISELTKNLDKGAPKIGRLLAGFPKEAGAFRNGIRIA